MSIIDQIFNRKCRVCDGRGVWQDRVESKDGMVEIVQKFCQSCGGSGRRRKTPEEDDAFDLAGVGVTEEDDSDEDL